MLFVIDPADPQAKQEDAQTSLAEAEAEMAEAREAVLAAEQELSAAQRQLVLRRQSLDRQRSLEKGSPPMRTWRARNSPMPAPISRYSTGRRWLYRRENASNGPTSKPNERGSHCLRLHATLETPT